MCGLYIWFKLHMHVQECLNKLSWVCNKFNMIACESVLKGRRNEEGLHKPNT